MTSFWFGVSAFLCFGIVACESDCPLHSIRYGEYCYMITALRQHYDIEEAQTSHSWTVDICSKHATHDKKRWRLPKADTEAKNADLARFIWRSTEGDAKENFVRLGLKREGPKTSNQTEWADRKYWVWNDDSKLTDEFWWPGMNRNSTIYPRPGEECVVGYIDRYDNKFRWRSIVCEKTERYGIITDMPINAIVCEVPAGGGESRLVRIIGSPTHRRWWFYMICVLMFLIGVACLVLAWLKFKKQPHVKMVVGMGRMQSPMPMDVRKLPLKTSRPFQWYTPPPFEKTGTASASTVKSVFDSPSPSQSIKQSQAPNEYANVLPRSKKSSKRSSKSVGVIPKRLRSPKSRSPAGSRKKSMKKSKKGK